MRRPAYSSPAALPSPWTNRQKPWRHCWCDILITPPHHTTASITPPHHTTCNHTTASHHMQSHCSKPAPCPPPPPWPARAICPPPPPWSRHLPPPLPPLPPPPPQETASRVGAPLQLVRSLSTYRTPASWAQLLHAAPASSTSPSSHDPSLPLVGLGGSHQRLNAALAVRLAHAYEDFLEQSGSATMAGSSSGVMAGGSSGTINGGSSGVPGQAAPGDWCEGGSSSNCSGGAQAVAASAGRREGGSSSSDGLQALAVAVRRRARLALLCAGELPTEYLVGLEEVVWPGRSQVSLLLLLLLLLLPLLLPLFGHLHCSAATGEPIVMLPHSSHISTTFEIPVTWHHISTTFEMPLTSQPRLKCQSHGTTFQPHLKCHSRLKSEPHLPCPTSTLKTLTCRQCCF